LKENQQFENTLILFLQDNGGCAEGMGRNGPFVSRQESPTLKALPIDYLQPDMIPKQTRDGFPQRQGKGVMPGGPDTYIGYGEAWANVSNTPFREYKHWEHEGGISSPLIAHWPKGIVNKRGQLAHDPCHLIDLMATCANVASAKYPTRYREEAIQPMEGISLAPAMSGKALERPQPLFWEHEGNRAVRIGNWKLVSKHPKEWELYDMASDRTEQKNLANEQTDRVREMGSLWDAWAKRVGVHSWPLQKPDSANKAKPKKQNAN
jgi:arylsulfatase